MYYKAFTEISFDDNGLLIILHKIADYLIAAKTSMIKYVYDKIQISRKCGQHSGSLEINTTVWMISFIIF